MDEWDVELGLDEDGEVILLFTTPDGLQVIGTLEED